MRKIAIKYVVYCMAFTNDTNKRHLQRINDPTVIKADKDIKTISTKTTTGSQSQPFYRC